MPIKIYISILHLNIIKCNIFLSDFNILFLISVCPKVNSRYVWNIQIGAQWKKGGKGFGIF